MIRKRYKCHVCGHASRRKVDLMKHVNGKHNGPLYTCKVRGCDFTTTWPACLNAHRIVHSDERPFTCDQCDFRAKTEGNVRRHVKMVHDKHTYLSCRFCPYRAPHPYRIRDHEKTHSKNRVYSCHLPECGFKAQNRSRLMQHKRSFHAQKFGDNFRSLRSLSSKRNNRTARVKIEYTDGDDIQFISQASDDNSSQWIDVSSDDEEAPDPSIQMATSNQVTRNKSKWRSCRFCNYKAQFPCHIKRHEEIHTRNGPFKCHLPGCSVSSKRKAELTKHIQAIHGSEKDPVRRSSRSRTRSRQTKSNDTHRVRFYNRNRRFECGVPHCGYSSDRAWNVKLHTVRVHPSINNRHDYNLRNKESNVNTGVQEIEQVVVDVVVVDVDNDSSSEWIDVSSDDEDCAVLPVSDDDVFKAEPFIVTFANNVPNNQADMLDMFLFP